MTSRYALAREQVRKVVESGEVPILAKGGAGSDVVVVPLGTGSALPTKYRNGWLLFFSFQISFGIIKH
jgi:hypothetical protein